MKHFKLFMMLALLVMGVSNAWAGEISRTYSVKYVGLPAGETGGYTVSRAYNRGLLSTTEGIDTENSTSTTIIMKNYAALWDPNQNTITLTNSNYNTYFRPNTIVGYDYAVSISGTVITITYTINTVDVEIGDYIYSTKWWRNGQSSTRIDLPEGEIAIALNPRYQETVTEPYVSGNSIRQRNRQTWTSHVVNAVIPATVKIGDKTFTVTAIQKLGFTYAQNHAVELYNCNNRIPNPRTDEQKEADGIYGSEVWTEEGKSTLDAQSLNDHSNWNLESVTFEAPDNIKYIGDYAFQSCVKLESIIIPKNVEYLGTGVCSTCPVLSDVRFQVDNTTHRTKIGTLRSGSFYLCRSIETLELPDGITVIEGASTSDHNGVFGPLQYLTGLSLIRLPNTLTTIGSHFLCCASSLRELTIPASVTSIDGAAFHGCESLESVYLLGPAAALQHDAGEGSDTFGENRTYCEEHVSGTTFYTTPDYLESYQQHPVWCIIDEKGLDNGSTYNNGYQDVTCNYANKLEALPEEKRDFIAGKWVTAIFPHGVSEEDITTKFGSGTRVAVPDVNTTPTISYGSQDDLVYNVTFKLISSTSVPAATPVMFCPQNTVNNYVMIGVEDYARDGFKEEMTKDHIKHPLTAEDGAHINMKGWYQTHTLMPWDFYFMYQNKTVDENGNPTYTSTTEKGKFYRVPKYEYPGVRVGATRCWWTISDATGVKSNTSNAKTMFFDDPETTGIKNVETRINIEGIYDLQGRKIDVKQSDLPEGMFIVNGKKLIKK